MNPEVKKSILSNRPLIDIILSDREFVKKHPDVTDSLKFEELINKENIFNGRFIEDYFAIVLFSLMDKKNKDDMEIVKAALKCDLRIVAFIPKEFFLDRECILSMVSGNGLMLQYLTEEQRRDKEIVLEAVKSNVYALKYVEEELRDDDEIALAAVQQEPWAFELLSRRLKDDYALASMAVSKYPDMINEIGESLKNNRDFILEHLDCLCCVETEVTRRFMHDKDIFLKAIQLGQIIVPHDMIIFDDDIHYSFERMEVLKEQVEDIPEEFKDDKEVMLKVVQINGYYLKYASESIKADYDVVLQAIRSCGLNLNFAAPSLKNNPDLIIEALKNTDEDDLCKLDFDRSLYQDGAFDRLMAMNDLLDFEQLKDEYFEDPDFVKAYSISTRPRLIQAFADQLFFRNQDLDLLINPNNDFHRLMVRNPRLRSNREFIINAAKVDPTILSWVDKQYLDDAEVMGRIISYDPKLDEELSFEFRDRLLPVACRSMKKKQAMALRYSLSVLFDDRDFMMDMVRQNGQCLKYASTRLRNDKELVLAAMDNEEGSVSCFGQELAQDLPFISENLIQKGHALHGLETLGLLDKDLALKAIENSKGKDFRYLSLALRNDHTIITAAVDHDGDLFGDVPIDYRRVPSKVLKVIQNMKNTDEIPSVLKHSEYVVQDDKRTVLEAVSRNGLSLQYASECMKEDKEIVLTALDDNWDAYEYVSDELKQNQILTSWISHFEPKRLLEKSLDEINEYKVLLHSFKRIADQHQYKSAYVIY